MRLLVISDVGCRDAGIAPAAAETLAALPRTGRPEAWAVWDQA
jgi:hypothetical protein